MDVDDEEVTAPAQKSKRVSKDAASTSAQKNKDRNNRDNDLDLEDDEVTPPSRKSGRVSKAASKKGTGNLESRKRKNLSATPNSPAKNLRSKTNRK